MKKIPAVLATLFLFALAAPALADEIGPAYPLTSDSTMSMTVDDVDAEANADEETGLLEYLLGLFE